MKTFGHWDPKIHESEVQQKRIASAKKKETTPAEVNKEDQTGRFRSSGKKPYEVSLENCTCVDFLSRKLPCKHMYRLAMECSVFGGEFQTGANKNEILANQISFEDAIAILENYTDKTQMLIKRLIGGVLYHRQNFLIINLYDFPDIIDCDFILHRDSSPEPFLSSIKKAEIVSMIENSDLDEKPEKSTLKKDLIAWVVEHKEDVPDAPRAIEITLVPEFAKEKKSIYSYLLRKYEYDFFYVDDAEKGMEEYRVPHGSEERNGGLYFFKEDKITKQLDLYGYNKCSGGFKPEKIGDKK